MELSDDRDITGKNKKRNIDDILRFRNHKRVADTTENLVSPVESSVNSKENCEAAGSSMSNGSKSLDLDENGVDVAEKEKKSLSNEIQEESVELESNEIPPLEESGELELNEIPVHDDDDPPPGIPTAQEMEEFLTRCEERIYKRFREKYNFDFEKEEPLEGRYKWVKI